MEEGSDKTWTRLNGAQIALDPTLQRFVLLERHFADPFLLMVPDGLIRAPLQRIAWQKMYLQTSFQALKLSGDCPGLVRRMSIRD